MFDHTPTGWNWKCCRRASDKINGTLIAPCERDAGTVTINDDVHCCPDGVEVRGSVKRMQPVESSHTERLPDVI